MSSKAILIIDVQRDFMPEGALAVPDADVIIPPLNSFIAKCVNKKIPVIATRDWHPESHCSFKENGGPWPRHCVVNTNGSQFAPELNLPKDAVVISKGTDKDKEAYSGFDGTTLIEILKRLGVRTLFIAGLATDYCVKYTVLDALKNGFEAIVLTDCIKGVAPGTTKEALSLMKNKGASFAKSTKLFSGGKR